MLLYIIRNCEGWKSRKFIFDTVTFNFTPNVIFLLLFIFFTKMFIDGRALFNNKIYLTLNGNIVSR